MRTYTIEEGENCYIYRAAILCELCGEAARERLTQEGLAPREPDEEATYDSDNFPKGPHEVKSDGDGGRRETCDSMDKCLSLGAPSCPSCRVTTINGLPCHETGCPDSWIDPATSRPYVRECKECGSEFEPEGARGARQSYCSDECFNTFAFGGEA